MKDFIAIGDTATDVFIRLEDESRARVEGAPRDFEYRISLPFAAKIPYRDAVTIAGVGNAPNAAVSAAKLGLSSALIARVGEDQAGQDTISSLEARGVDTSLMASEPGKKTNYSYILWYQDDRTILRRNEEFAYTMPKIEAPRWIYVSSVGSHALDIYDEIALFLDENPGVKMAFQPGSKEIPLGKKLSHIYERSFVYFSNIEEAGLILGIQTLGIRELLKRMRETGPKIVVITDGPRGAYAYDGEKFYFQKTYPDPKPPLERTGAGDAFSSTVAVALAQGKALPEALQWGAVNAMSVVQKVGAQEGLLNKEEIEEFIKNAPADFQPEILEN